MEPLLWNSRFWSPFGEAYYFDVSTLHGHKFRSLPIRRTSRCEEEGVVWQFAPWTRPLQEHFVTKTDESNPWWLVFRDAMAAMKHKVEPEVFPAATDSRFLRELEIPALGFSPMKKCPILLHEHNEYLEVETFLEGIEVYVGLLEALASKEKLPGEEEQLKKRRLKWDLMFLLPSDRSTRSCLLGVSQSCSRAAKENECMRCNCFWRNPSLAVSFRFKP